MTDPAELYRQEMNKRKKRLPTGDELHELHASRRTSSKALEVRCPKCKSIEVRHKRSNKTKTVPAVCGACGYHWRTRLAQELYIRRGLNCRG